MATIRNIPNIRIANFEPRSADAERDSYQILFEIFAGFGENFQRIEFIDCRIATSDLKTIILLTKNVKSLLFKSCDIACVMAMDELERIQTTQLTNLTMLYCSPEFEFITLALTRDIITELNVVSGSPQFLINFLAKQSNLKKLSLSACGSLDVCGSTMLRNMKLEQLRISVGGFYGDGESISSIIHRQGQFVTSLDLSSFKLTDKIFLQLVKMPQLTSLQIVVNEVSLRNFLGMKQLKNLKELTLIRNDGRHDDRHLRIISETSNHNLVKLEIKYPGLHTDANNFIRLAENAKSIQHLSIDGAITSKILVNVIRHMQSLQTLKMHDLREFGIPVELLDILIANSDISRNMRNLSLKFGSLDNSALIFCMIKNFPNIEVFEIETTMHKQFMFTALSYILRCWKHLRELHLINLEPMPLYKQLINLLKAHASGLKRVNINVRKTSLPLDIIKARFDQKYSFISLRDEHLELGN